MVGPRQINVRRLLGAVALFGVVLRCMQLCAVARCEHESYGLLSPQVLYFIAAFVAGGAAVGCAEGRPIRGAIAALCIYAACIGGRSFLFWWQSLPRKLAELEWLAGIGIAGCGVAMAIIALLAMFYQPLRRRLRFPIGMFAIGGAISALGVFLVAWATAID